MMNPLSWLKYRMSHVSAKTWHVRLTKAVWDNKIEGKACTYYWYKLPVAVIILALTFSFMVLIASCAFFCGFLMNFYGDKDPRGKLARNPETGRPYVTFPYKTLPNGKKFPVAPWEVTLAVGIGYLLWIGIPFLLRHIEELTTFFAELLGLLLTVLIILVAIIIGGGLSILLFIAFRKAIRNPSLSQAKAEVRAAWNKACPPLVVEGDLSSDKEPATSPPA